MQIPKYFEFENGATGLGGPMLIDKTSGEKSYWGSICAHVGGDGR